MRFNDFSAQKAPGERSHRAQLKYTNLLCYFSQGRHFIHLFKFSNPFDAQKTKKRKVISVFLKHAKEFYQFICLFNGFK